jgi:hypothetical protein
MTALRNFLTKMEHKTLDAIGLSPLNTQEGGNHYKEMQIQPAEFIHQNDIPYLEGCVIKYICRHRKKGGLMDLQKAKHYIDLIIQFEYRNQL